MLPNICLCLHCIKGDSMPEPQVHRELFIGLAELEDLILSLKAEGYRFTLPGDAGKENGPVCSVTFDDGYFNSTLFVETAEKHAIPFILFISSYNVIHRIPFIWDIWEASRTEKWPVSSVDYGKLYQCLSSSEKILLDNGTHRPLTAEEMDVLSAHPLVHFAPHVAAEPTAARTFMKKLVEYESGPNAADLKDLTDIEQNMVGVSTGPSAFAESMKTLGVGGVLGKTWLDTISPYQEDINKRVKARIGR